MLGRRPHELTRKVKDKRNHGAQNMRKSNRRTNKNYNKEANRHHHCNNDLLNTILSIVESDAHVGVYVIPILWIPRMLMHRAPQRETVGRRRISRLHSLSIESECIQKIARPDAIDERGFCQLFETGASPYSSRPADEWSSRQGQVFCNCPLMNSMHTRAAQGIFMLHNLGARL